MGEKKHYYMGNPGKREKVKVEKTHDVFKALEAQKSADKRIEVKQVEIDTATVRCKPLGDRMILKRLLGDEKQGLIIVPNPVREESEKGKVIAIGDGYKDEPTTTPIGATVLFAKHGVTDIEIDGGAYLLCRESDILAVL